MQSARVCEVLFGQRLQGAQTLAARRVQHECAAARLGSQQAGPTQSIIGAGDRVEVDAQPGGQGADRGQTIAGAQPAAAGMLTDLLHQLDVDGLMQTWVKGQR